MRNTNLAILAVFSFAAVVLTRVHAAAESPGTQPSPTLTTTAPSVASTRPAAGATISGKVTIGGDWSLQKPDLTRVVVYLASNPSLDSDVPPTGHATIAQRHKAFVPNFAVVARDHG